MREAIPPLPNTPSWRGAQLNTGTTLALEFKPIPLLLHRHVPIVVLQVSVLRNSTVSGRNHKSHHCTLSRLRFVHLTPSKPVSQKFILIASHPQLLSNAYFVMFTNQHILLYVEQLNKIIRCFVKQKLGMQHAGDTPLTWEQVYQVILGLR
jgi:hypothetical protein